ncbi:serine/threonine-protein kinase [Nocardioides alcanivorans]|uniref:serine/threonine-protein kinase n=1 Tax=Nocardioides alcanivorans TaxID=2897352 RepID=UPI001F1C63BF|nr:serine/threonine-protein kinase [Nocardioides alcanivorans]
MEQLVAGRYALLREVGRGGMGAVWLAHDELLNREVALKRLAARDGLGETEERVRREARVSAMLNHSGVVTVYDLADAGDEIWLVMEYVDSVTLSGLVRDVGPLSPDHSAALIAQAADALAVAHEAGIVHRDVKPGNMLVTRDGHLKLGDFGIARTGSDASLTATGLVTGSPGYLAPEVAAGSSATAASDVWSLGASIFHTLTGKPPFDTSDNLMGALYRLVHEEPPRTDRAGWLEPALRGTMERDPQQRWSAQQVHAFLKDGPDAHPPQGRSAMLPPVPSAEGPETAAHSPQPSGDVPTQQTQVIRTNGRNSRGTTLIALVAVVLVAALGIGAWLVLRGGDDDNSSEGVGEETSATTPPGQSTTPPAIATPDAADMEQFVADYLSTVTSDTKAGFDLLTPEYQQESNGLKGYRSWWRQVRSADLLQVDAQAEELSVSYRVRYDMKQGPDRVENITLDLAFDDGEYRIAGTR